MSGGNFMYYYTFLIHYKLVVLSETILMICLYFNNAYINVLSFIYKSTYYWQWHGFDWLDHSFYCLQPIYFPWRLSWLRFGPFSVKVNTSLVGCGSLALCILISRAWFWNIALALSHLSENKSWITLVLSLN